MSNEEKILRENRKKNFAWMLAMEKTNPHRLASQMNVDTSYISQLKNGFRPITFEVARQIEDATPGMQRLSLDSPHETFVSPITDSEAESRVLSVIREVCRAHKQPSRGDMFDAVLRLCMVDVRLRGYNEGRVRYIAGEFFK